MNKIVFLGGIHGTGKGFISETICNNIPLEYLSASQLVKWSEISPDIQNKSVANISDTQDRLITALRAFSNENKNYLLDVVELCTFFQSGIAVHCFL